MTDLPPYDHDAPCPKCRFIAGTTQYYKGYHGTPCSFTDAALVEMYFSYGVLSFGVRYSEEEKRERAVEGARMMEVRNAIPEHFERVCPNCKHQWAEGLPDKVRFDDLPPDLRIEMKHPDVVGEWTIARPPENS